MTTPISETARPQPQPKAENFMEWVELNSRLVIIGGIVVVAAALGLWVVKRTNANATVNADKQLVVAKQSIGSGNTQLAESDLKKVVDKYAGKPAGSEAGLLLAQLQLDRGDATSAISGLQALADKVKTGPTAPSIRGMLGDAMVQAGKPAEGAAEYEKAAQATSLPNEKAFWMNKAGRAYLAGGKSAEAKRVFEALAIQTDNQTVATEARVRLGEMSLSGTP